MSDCTVLFFFNDTSTTEIYTLSLHDALPILRWDIIASSAGVVILVAWLVIGAATLFMRLSAPGIATLLPVMRSEEHTSELQSPMYLVCRLLLEKKKKNKE